MPKKLFDYLFKNKNKMNYYLIGYAYTHGFGNGNGNGVVGFTGPIDAKTIRDWEKLFETKSGKVSVISISKIDGPITPTDSAPVKIYKKCVPKREIKNGV